MRKNDVFDAPQEENEHSIRYWLKNHKFVVLLYTVATIAFVVGAVLFVKQMIADFERTIRLLGGLSPLLLLVVAGIFATAKEQLRKRKEKRSNK